MKKRQSKSRRRSAYPPQGTKIEKQNKAVADAGPAGVVGIGGSAGSLEVLHTVLSGLPADFDMAIVVVQHLAPHVPSMIAELLAAHTPLHVETALKNTAMRGGVVYVVPPDVLLEVSGLELRVVAAKTGETRNGIDYFLTSLAQGATCPIVGVVLSGSSSDGAAGLREVKAAGGITLVQDPHTTRFDAAPRAAITTKAADKVLKPEEIAGELVNIWRHPLVKPSSEAAPKNAEEAALGDQSLTRVFTMLWNASGVDFTHYKQPTIKRRLQRRMVLHKMATLAEYVKYMERNIAEVTALYQDLLIHVTRFFREPESFEVLAAKVFPEIQRARETDLPIRIWVPGCSTGEEPYSVAIALLEYLGSEAISVPVQIFATDVSEAAIEHARVGVYPESISEDVSAERLRRFFSKSDGNYRVAKAVRDCCVFARQDLTRDPPFSRLDLIVCRNVLIYLGALLQKRLINMFHYALRPTGFLMLGGAETVGAHVDLFAVADKRLKLYTKKMTGFRSGMKVPSSEASEAGPGAKRVNAEVRGGSTIQSEANRIILARYSPPGVIVDDDLKIVQFRGQTGMFLEPAPGEASLNVLKMAREGLLHGMRTAVYEARRSGAETRKRGVRIKSPEGPLDVTISVHPLGGESGEGRHFLVLFDTSKATATAEELEARRDLKEARKRGKKHDPMQRLRDELAANREYLQSIIQDLEAANEELQSANEEILSSNEELQSTNEELDTAKEELQSTNEELNTVNEELQGRNEELMRVNSDLVNLVASVQIAIVMVSPDLRIRRFTPMAEKVLNLIATDVGRPISDIKPNIECDDLEKLIAESIDTVTIKEREVRDRNGARYSLRIRPYKDVENRIDGAVLALFDGSRAAEASGP